MDYKYKISVIMAVYNAGPFLKEAVDSLIMQDIGFENIQLIMVDDGSTDDSPAICDEYAQMYPNNIFPVHKENGGVASARNEGLKYAEGKYLNFMDSDDKFELDAFKKMYDFFEEHEEETDMVTIPLQFFDAMEGEHWGNKKFKQGSRVIDLVKEPSNSLMFVNASLFKSEMKDEIVFDSSLPCGEDAKVIYTLLQKKKTMGVVDKTCYHYRRTSSGGSLIASSQTKKSWYKEYFINLNNWLVNYHMEKDGELPLYVQYMFVSEMQWRFTKDSNTIVERGILTDEEYDEYKTYIKQTLSYISDEMMMQVSYLYFEQKVFLLMMKYGKDAHIISDYINKRYYLGVENTIVGNLSRIQFTIELCDIVDSTVVVEGYLSIPASFCDAILVSKFNDEEYEAEWLSEGRPALLFKEQFLLRKPYRFIFNTDGLQVGEKGDFALFYIKTKGMVINLDNVKYGKRSPFSRNHKNMFYYKNGITVQDEQKCLYIGKDSETKLKERRKDLRKELLSNKKDKAALKAVVVRAYLPTAIKNKKKPIWLISDRYEKAGDNGEAFFKYMVENHPEIETHFLLFKSSEDYDRLSKIGSVLEPYSWTHKMKHLMADAIVSAHADDFIYSPFRATDHYYKELIANKKFVFLQHGIIKDDISRLFNRLDNNMSMFVTSVVPEYKSLLECQYLYTEKQVKLTGLPRYDLLDNRAKKKISIMPTWRSYTVTGTDSRTGRRYVKPGYEKTLYYKMYSELLSSDRFISEAEKRGYKIQWVIHPNMTAFQDVFEIDERIEVVPENVLYRDVFEEASLLITDYSSVAFDVAYMRKPVVYYQADKEEFFSGIHTYDKGYFEYERDGLGEVEYSLTGLIDTIIAYMDNDCQLNPKYRERIDNFYAFDDKNNCQRVYNEIINL